MDEAAVLSRWVARLAPDMGAEPVAAEAPGRVLAGLLDLRGAVALVRYLTEPAATAPPTLSDPRALRAQLRSGLAGVNGRLEEDLASMFKARYRLPTAERAWAVLVRAEAHTHRKGAPLKNATRALWAPCHDFFDTRIKRARFALRDLRDELEPDLAGLGEAAARLACVDRGLELACRTAVDDLLRRGLLALEARFAAAVRALVRSLPADGSSVPASPVPVAAGVAEASAHGEETPHGKDRAAATGEAPADAAGLAATPDGPARLPPLPLVVARAFGPDGFFVAEMELGRAWVRAQVQRDQQRLQALVDGATATRTLRP